MSKRANPTLIGAFVIGAVAITFFAIYFFASRSLFEKKNKFVLYFDKPVNGLEIGAPVKFKGVEMGKVDDILLYVGEEFAYVPVIVEIASMEKTLEGKYALNLYDEKIFDNQIANGLRATVMQQSYLTGKLFVELDYFAEDVPPRFVNLPSPYKEIPTIKSRVGEIWAMANQLLDRISKINFEELVDNMNSVMKKMDEVEFKKISDTLLSTLDSFGSFSDKLDKEVDPAIADMRNAFQKIDKAADSVDGFVGPDSSFRYQFESALDSVSSAARSFENLTNYLERNPSSLLRGKQ